MAKIRKTKQQKIIAQLRRKLNQGVPLPARQEPISYRISPDLKPKIASERTDKANLSVDNRFVKGDLLKTLALSVAIISLEVVLYFRLR